MPDLLHGKTQISIKIHGKLVATKTLDDTMYEGEPHICASAIKPEFKSAEYAIMAS